MQKHTIVKGEHGESVLRTSSMKHTQAVTGERTAARSHYFKVAIVETGAALFSSDYSRFNDETSRFGSLEDVKAFLKERYGKARRAPMYRDNKNGATNQCGYIYTFRNADWSHAPVQKWNQCDWVTISQVEETEILA